MGIKWHYSQSSRPLPLLHILSHYFTWEWQPIVCVTINSTFRLHCAFCVNQMIRLFKSIELPVGKTRKCGKVWKVWTIIQATVTINSDLSPTTHFILAFLLLEYVNSTLSSYWDRGLWNHPKRLSSGIPPSNLNNRLKLHSLLLGPENDLA